MKRHNSLINLSHDHHHGLLLAQLIKKNAPVYKDLPNNTEGKVKHVINSWENELKFHFENEEKILFPAIVGKNKEIDDLVEEILSEHKLIKNLVLGLEKADNTVSLLNELGLMLENHIRKEERQLFQLIQTHFPKELDNLDGKIPPAKNSCNN